jgi:hypothetical protein
MQGYYGSGACIGFGLGGSFGSLLLILPWLPLRLNAVLPLQALKRFLLQPIKSFILQAIKRFLQSILMRLFGLLLGRSTSDEFSTSEHDRWKSWMGRIRHFEKNVTGTVDGSEDRVKASSFHKAVEDSENSVKASVDSSEASVSALKTRLDATLKEILLCLEKTEKK